MTDAELTQLLTESKTIAVVGLSDNPSRASYGVARFLQRQKFRVIPVNPALTEVLGEKCYPRVEDIPDRNRYCRCLSQIGICAGSGCRCSQEAPPLHLDAGRRRASRSRANRESGRCRSGHGPLHSERIGQTFAEVLVPGFSAMHPRAAFCKRAFKLYAVLAAILCLQSCAEERQTLGKAYVAPHTLNVRSDISAKSGNVTTLKHG